MLDLLIIPASSEIIPYSGCAFCNSSIRIFSVLLSAEETKSPGAFEETCRFSNSPKSLINDLEAFIHALVIILIFVYFITYSITYSVRVSITIFSPLSTNGGRSPFMPQSRIAGLYEEDAV